MIVALTGQFYSPFQQVANYFRQKYGSIVINLIQRIGVSSLEELLVTIKAKEESQDQQYIKLLQDIKKNELTPNYKKNFVIYPAFSPYMHSILEPRNYYYLLNISCSFLTRFSIFKEALKSREMNSNFPGYCLIDGQQESKITIQEFGKLEEELMFQNQIFTSIISKSKKVVHLHKFESAAELKPQLDQYGNLCQSTITRPNWDIYYMQMAFLSATRSNCMKRTVGAVIVKHKRVVSTGYSGVPFGLANCNEGGCKRCNSGADTGVDLAECYCLHAEMNAIIYADKAKCEGAFIYCTTFPCIQCAVSIVQAGIKRVIYSKDYGPNKSKDLLEKAKVEINCLIL